MQNKIIYSNYLLNQLEKFMQFALFCKVLDANLCNKNKNDCNALHNFGSFHY